MVNSRCLLLCILILTCVTTYAQPNAYIKEFPQGYTGLVRSVTVTEQLAEQQENKWTATGKAITTRRVEYDKEGHLLKDITIPTTENEDTLITRYEFRTGSDTCINITEIHKLLGGIAMNRRDTASGAWASDSTYNTRIFLWVDGQKIAVKSTFVYDQQKRICRNEEETEANGTVTTRTGTVSYKGDTCTISIAQNGTTEQTSDIILERDAQNNPARILSSDINSYYIRTYTYEYY